MDTSSFSCFTPEVKRLSTFQITPIKSQQNLCISNSPAKFAKAGFYRSAGAPDDDVTCEYCGITYGGWSGESPFAVHRVLNEHCPFLTTPPPSNSIYQHPRVVEARRRLFPENDEDNDESIDSQDDSGANETPEPYEPPYVSVLSAQAAISHPFRPVGGDFSMLFASRRLKTFTDQGCPECVTWAEEGFVFNQETLDVQCVFCGVFLPFDAFDPRQLHAERSASCPRVLYIDVGNITAAEEERIRLKNLQRQLRSKPSSCNYAIAYPQYEEESVRVGTYENWPYSAWDEMLQPPMMSAAGFFFTGCADKVRCYSCGLSLHKWRQGADPWEQHAHHMPTCPHLQQQGQHFIQQAADVQVLTEAELPSTAGTPESGSSPGELVTSPPGSPTLDIAALNAAIATSQYTIQQIRHAVLTFFLQTSRYPTKEILLGTLKAADENFTALCQQRDTIHQQGTVIQQKDTELQQKDTELQQKDTELQQKDTVLQQKDTVLQHQSGQLEEKDQELQMKEEELRNHREELQRQEAELQRQEVELQRKTRQVRYQDQQIESLRLQVQALLAERRLAGQGAALVQAANPAPGPSGDGPIMHDIRCKVCLSEESNSIFQPCLHVSCCRQCAHQLLNTPCPVCRVRISDVMPAYIS